MQLKMPRAKFLLYRQACLNFYYIVMLVLLSVCLMFYENPESQFNPNPIANFKLYCRIPIIILSQSWTWDCILSNPNQTKPQFILSYPQTFNFIHLSLPKINFILLCRNCIGTPLFKKNQQIRFIRWCVIIASSLPTNERG